MPKLIPIFLLAGLLLSLSGCSRNTVAVKRASLALQTALQSQESANRALDKLSEQATKAEQEGKIATSANAEIQTYVSTERTQLATTAQKLQSQLEHVGAYSAGQIKATENEIIKNANEAVTQSAAVMRILEKKTEVIVDFLGSETYSKSEIGALFRPGEYHLIPEQVKEGQRLFRPIVEKLFTFADKYKESFKSLKGEIIVTGYSDATPVEPGSRLYRDLVQHLQQQDNVANPSSSDLNQKLSELRASAVKSLLESLIDTKKQANANLLDISVTVLGRGEAIPRGMSDRLAANDRRRRVVTFYWVVLPTL
ncbi:hypothetical protein [Spirosoma spitsbergense]|uniref:hypothetical protein n=1 Tax=Spirosoma spitsbergense TaxID=431554 RepID=UPI00037987CC|nr:hypothetical protein [Spirosoma spitsbergense]